MLLREQNFLQCEDAVEESVDTQRECTIVPFEGLLELEL